MNASDEIVDFLVEQIPTTALAGFQPSAQARERIWELVTREKDAGLLPEERLELDDYMKLEHLLILAKAKARLIQQNGSRRQRAGPAGNFRTGGRPLRVLV